MVKIKGENMKKVIVSLPLLAMLLLGSQEQKVTDCVETFQNEIAQIIYANIGDKNSSIEVLTNKINTILDENCDLNNSQVQSLSLEKKNPEQHVIMIDTTKKNKDCIESFQNDLRDILYSDNAPKAKEKKIKIVIKGDGDNCTKETTDK